MDNQEFFKRLVKYCLEGLAVAIASYAIPQRSMDKQEIVTIALTAAATFAVLDVLAPSIALGARKGAGFGIGASVSGYKLPSISNLMQAPTPAPQVQVPAGASV